MSGSHAEELAELEAIVLDRGSHPIYQRGIGPVLAARVQADVGRLERVKSGAALMRLSLFGIRTV